ncbi:2-oxo-4-hydroxy-4-carboxy-5-ureidoimidazoline decarboxylase [Umezawaea tangerina]|uniref:2-oxo-4-hydroxy-4-carboxy-5-ureidoimidazoline decarboxylase n=1 Tax=Umezawaea tangerina TaxID=84725 RepID=A0A2T0TAI2_9PSEU|nr:2-oxo-4-hydroxy-4-carboxy-5-ureidoimidazoline decarboxylase [Umezawaea tangerina]PRY42683.1 2-oxo-4-hydroxy-4-carboxy-5-ureidoimidazoline decarboxylase [Umezawaea tangerina]
MPGLQAFNTAPADELRPLLTECLAVPRWVDAVLAARPYPDVDALVAAAEVDLSTDEIHGAIAGHPRIGERARHDGVSAKWSAAEQSGVDLSVADRLVAANLAYEERFGHIYLVCATGLSGEQMLADLASRMGNDPDTELRVVNGELARIAALRLRKAIA